MSQRVGLIAGRGDLPREIARSAPGRLLVLGFRGLTDPQIERAQGHVSVAWFELGEVECLLAALEEASIKQLVIAGHFDPALLVRTDRGIGGDDRAASLLAGLAGAGERDVMGTVAGVLSGVGIEVLPQTTWTPHLLPGAGALGKHEPSDGRLEDLTFGWPIARKIAGLHVGQAIAVKDRCVVAVEGLEGTDAMIARAIDLAGDNVTVIKCARPDQDLRFDLPTIGPDTISALSASRGALLAFEPGKTVLLHRSRCVEIADRAKIAVLGTPLTAAPSADVGEA